MKGSHTAALIGAVSVLLCLAYAVEVLVDARVRAVDYAARMEAVPCQDDFVINHCDHPTALTFAACAQWQECIVRGNATVTHYDVALRAIDAYIRDFTLTACTFVGAILGSVLTLAITACSCTRK